MEQITMTDTNTTPRMGPDWTEEMEAIGTKRPIFTVYEGTCYWSMPDGSTRSITADDAKRINDALRAMENQHDR